MGKEDQKEYCLLWAEARDLAKDKGLNMSQNCPMETLCKGEKCTFIDPKKKVMGIIYKVEPEVIMGC
jgi:hypothetical protein